VVKGCESMFCHVIDLSLLGDGKPDILVWCRTRYILVEIKNPKTGYGRKGLNKNQKSWAEEWMGGPVYVVSNREHVISLVTGQGEVPHYGGGTRQLSRRVTK